MKRSLILVSVLLTACEIDKVKYQEQLDRPHVESTTLSCTHSGFCYDCGIDENFEFSCRLRLSDSCPGTQPGTVEVTPFEVGYESGRRERFNKVRELTREGICR